MDPRNLYILRYRESAGVLTSYVIASSKEAADLVGQAYCQQSPSRRFIRTETAIVADESILNDADRARVKELIDIRVAAEKQFEKDQESPARVQPQPPKRTNAA